jgi:hypothetical protein
MTSSTHSESQHQVEVKGCLYASCFSTDRVKNEDVLETHKVKVDKNILHKIKWRKAD